MPLVNVERLVEEGMSPELVQKYVDAVNAAWDQVASKVKGLGTRPSMLLHLEDPERDRLTVTVTIGLAARFGATSANTPEGLREALVRHLSPPG
jgi:hypothetical protein